MMTEAEKELMKDAIFTAVNQTKLKRRWRAVAIGLMFIIGGLCLWIGLY